MEATPRAPRRPFRSSTEALELLAQLDGDAWLVGGAVRDQLLGRATRDLDVIVQAGVPSLARALARAGGAHAFALSEAFGAWRVVARDRSWQVDLSPTAGGRVEEDLGKRDLTVNALARRPSGGALLDPFGGARDLEERRLRMVSETAFIDDPLRVARLARLAAELDFEIDPATAQAAYAAAPGLARVAPERVFAELREIVCGPRPGAGLRAIEELGGAAAVLPELLALRGVVQSDYHDRDVHDHTLEVVERAAALGADPSILFPDQAPELRVVLAEPLADELTRGQALRFGALLHDVGKPITRELTAGGRVTFLGHDAVGSELTRRILSRLRVSERLREHVAALTAHHLRLGFLVHQQPLDRRTLYRYLRTCQPVEVEVTLLSVADRLATLGRGSERAIERHLELARSIMPEALRWRSEPPRPPVRGDRLARALGIDPGPELGRILAELTEAAYAHEVLGEDEAIAWARELPLGSRE